MAHRLHLNDLKTNHSQQPAYHSDYMDLRKCGKWGEKIVKRIWVESAIQSNARTLYADLLRSNTADRKAS